MKRIILLFATAILIMSLCACDFLEDSLDDLMDDLNDQMEIGEELVEIDPSELGDDDVQSVGDFTVSNFGGGANKKNDSSDNTSLQVIHHFPDNNGKVYSGSVLQIFFNDVILTSSLEDGLEVTRNGSKVSGEVNLNPDKLGGSVLTFSPSPAFAAGDVYKLTLNSSLKDNGGNGLSGGETFTFSVVDREDKSYFDAPFSFDKGIVFEGDGAILDQTWQVPAKYGKFAAISTSENGALSGTGAINAITSRMIFYLNGDISKLTISCNFISGEFNEWVFSNYDDTSMIMITDSEGKTVTQTIASVKGIGTYGNNSAGDFYGINSYDGFNGQSGRKAKELNFARKLTPPLTMTFSVQDVADSIVDSVLVIDDVSF